MTIADHAEEAFAYLEKRFGNDYATNNPSVALRFVGDWMNAAARDDVGSAILSLQDALFALAPEDSKLASD